jgi:hypothetical protein
MPGLAELVANAFDLGSPADDLRPIQVGSHESWRLDTAAGSFMIKRLWRGQDPTWWPEHETSMELERRALGAGLPIAIPVEPVTSHIRNLYARSSDYLVSHRDFGPWNVLRVTDRLVLIDWENAGPTTATVELGRAVLAFGGGDPNRMRRLIDGYRAAGGVITGRIQDLFSWELTQHLSQLTERVRISVGDLDPEDDPVPIWVDPSTIDHDITAATTSLRAKADELAATASQL